MCPSLGVECPVGYEHLGDVSDPRTCVSVLSSPTALDTQICDEPDTDKLRENTLVTGYERVEKIRPMLR